MAERKIALIIAGGVSLGSYEAGVLTELLYLLDTYNRSPDHDNFKIDVITGGSAGSINSALLARIIMHGYDKRHILHDLWVGDTDIRKLLYSASSGQSLFSRHFQRQMGDRYLNVITDSARPASFAADELHLAFSLSNMVGIDYEVPYSFSARNPQKNAEHTFMWTFFQDYYTAVVKRGHEPDELQWESIKAAAIASGSFPVAFEPNFVRRLISDFPGAKSSLLPGDHAISDGGMFDNEPVKHAIKFASQIDGGQPSKDRLFLLIDPSVNTSKQNAKFLKTEATTSLFQNLYRLSEMVLGQSAAKDWLKAGKTNNQLRIQQEVLNYLPELVNAIDPQQLDSIHQKQQIADEAIIGDAPLLPQEKTPAADHFAGALAGTRAHAEKYLLSIGVPGEKADLFEKRRKILQHLIFEMNSAAALSNKNVLNLQLIGANKDYTAGDDFFALSGFFDQRWREHDFRVGRRLGHRLLPDFLSQSGIDCEPDVTYENDPDWGDLTKATIRDTDKSVRKAFKNRALDMVESAMTDKPMELNWLSRKMARQFVKRYLNKLLGL